MTEWLPTIQTSTTMDPPDAALLVRVRPQNGIYLASDFTGTRRGYGRTLLHAVEDWASAVQWLITEPTAQLTPSLRKERAAYRKALPDEDSAS